MTAGVIVAGGRSTRFGDTDKALATLDGTPMIRRVADRLVQTVSAIVVNCREEQIERIGAALEGLEQEVTFAPDPDPDEGPMAGIRTGLRATDAEYAAVVACDMPFVEPALIEHLFERAEGRDAAVPRLEDGWYQPTQAVYRATAMADACERALDKGDRRIIAPFDEIEVIVLEAAEIRDLTSLETFENINTRDEFEAAKKRLGED